MENLGPMEWSGTQQVDYNAEVNTLVEQLESALTKLYLTEADMEPSDNVKWNFYRAAQECANVYLLPADAPVDGRLAAATVAAYKVLEERLREGNVEAMVDCDMDPEYFDKLREFSANHDAVKKYHILTNGGLFTQVFLNPGSINSTRDRIMGKEKEKEKKKPKAVEPPKPVPVKEPERPLFTSPVEELDVPDVPSDRLLTDAELSILVNLFTPEELIEMEMDPAAVVPEPPRRSAPTAAEEGFTSQFIPKRFTIGPEPIHADGWQDQSPDRWRRKPIHSGHFEPVMEWSFSVMYLGAMLLLTCKSAQGSTAELTGALQENCEQASNRYATVLDYINGKLGAVPTAEEAIAAAISYRLMQNALMQNRSAITALVMSKGGYRRLNNQVMLSKTMEYLDLDGRKLSPDDLQRCFLNESRLSRLVSLMEEELSN